ncbi:kinase-like domain-containing protein [Mycena filopes]|nr:kinase-like domain-containing protein [Mycena filopes]
MKLNYTGTDPPSIQPPPFPQGELEWPSLHQSAEEEAGDFDPLAWAETGIMDRMRSLVCPDNPKSIYVMISKLGEGWFGPVYQARETATRRRVAIARNDMTNQQKHFFLDHLLLLKEMKHPNIVLFLESYLVGPEELWIVSEFIEGLDLSEIVGNHQLAEEQMSNICLQTCQGLEHLHSQNIIHRDIRPDNIFVDPQGCVKIKGFGFCVKLTNQRPRRTSMAGKPHWMAPEVAKQTESDGKKVEYDGKVDVWSLGITTLELSGAGNGPGPYMNDEPLTALYFVGPDGTPTLTDADALSAELRNFLEACLSVDVQRRATVAKLLNHPFLQKACNSAGLLSLLRPTWVRLRRHITQYEKSQNDSQTLLPRLPKLPQVFGAGKVVNHM